MQSIPEIDVREFKKFSLRGASVIDGFPSVGSINAIVATYLVSSLNLDQIAALDSEDFPPISMIYDSKPKFPARIYARSDLATFVAEFAPHARLFRSIARAMIEWGKQNQCARIVTSLGVPYGTGGSIPDVYSVASTEQGRKLLERAGVPQVKTGIIPGIAGVLLNEGRWNQFEVIALVTQTRDDVPDARASARILETMVKLLPSLHIDLKPLYQEAERIESALKALRQQAKPMEESISRVYG
jgi:uncharacterized protein